MRWNESHNFNTFAFSFPQLSAVILRAPNRSDYLYFAYIRQTITRSRNISPALVIGRSCCRSDKRNRRQEKSSFRTTKIFYSTKFSWRFISFSRWYTTASVCVGLFEEHKANLILFMPSASTLTPHISAEELRRFWGLFCEYLFGIGFQRMRMILRSFITVERKPSRMPLSLFVLDFSRLHEVFKPDEWL